MSQRWSIRSLFDCRLGYVGQTGHCLNDRLTEHKRKVKNKAQISELANHVGSCNFCSPFRDETSVLLTKKICLGG